MNLELEKNLLCLVHLAGQFMGSNLHRVMPNNPNLCPLQAISLTSRFSSRRYFKLLSYPVALQLSWSSERSFLVLELTCSQQDNLKELCSPVHTTSFLTTLLADFFFPFTELTFSRLKLSSSQLWLLTVKSALSSSADLHTHSPIITCIPTQSLFPLDDHSLLICNLLSK